LLRRIEKFGKCWKKTQVEEERKKFSRQRSKKRYGGVGGAGGGRVSF
jgi:hypothetical protein